MALIRWKFKYGNLVLSGGYSLKNEEKWIKKIEILEEELKELLQLKSF